MTKLDELYKIAREVQIKIINMPMEESIAISSPKGAIAVDKRKIKTLEEEKSVVAHELGHHMTGTFYTIKTLETRPRMEQRANRWSYRKLIPWRELKTAIENDIDEPWQLAEYFKLPERIIREALDFYLKAQPIEVIRSPLGRWKIPMLIGIRAQ